LQLRVRFFEKYITDCEDIQSVRQVCTALKHEIDQIIGIKKPISCSFSLAYEDCDRVEFIRSIALQHVRLNYLDELIIENLQDVLSYPKKLRICEIKGIMNAKVIHEIFNECCNLTALFISAGILPALTDCTMNTDATYNKVYHFRSMKNLTIILLQGSTLKSKDQIANAQGLLRSIRSATLSVFIFKIEYNDNSVSDLLMMLLQLTDFIRLNPTLKSISMCILAKGSIMESADGTFQTKKQECLQLVKRIKSFIAEMKMIKSINFGKWNIREFLMEGNFEEIANQPFADLWTDFLASSRSGDLTSIGFKVRSVLPGPMMLRLIDSNFKSLTKCFLEFTMPFSIDFFQFSNCRNLEYFSIHNVERNYFNYQQGQINWPTIVFLYNVNLGLDLLEKLKCFIVNGLVMQRLDVEQLVSRPLKVLGLKKLSLREYFGDDVAPPGGIPSPAGITYQAFMDVLKNRSLEALLIDTDSTYLTSMVDGINMERAIERLSGKFRSFMLDLSESTREDFPYWRPSFLGFSVYFPFF
jgi:hypothetical protein